MKKSSLNKVEEHQLIQNAQEGNLLAKELLIENNKGLIGKFAKYYLTRNVEYEELYQEGLMGLIEAIDHFDLRKNVCLATFAGFWIRKKILLFLNASGVVNISDKDMLLLKKLALIEMKYEILGEKPSISDYASNLKVSEKKVLILLSLHKHEVRIDERIKDTDERITFMSSTDKTPEEILIETDLKSRIQELFFDAKLSSKQIAVLNLRYGLTGLEPLTLLDISKILHSERENIRQLEARALMKIRMTHQIKDFIIYAENIKKARENLELSQMYYHKKEVPIIKSIDKIRRK